MHRYGVNGNGRAARAFEEDSRFHHTSWVTEEGVKFLLEDRDPSCPFFLHLSYWAPHPPLLPPQQYFDKYIVQCPEYNVNIGDWVGGGTPRKGVPIESATGPFFTREIQEAMAGYYGLIEHVDDQLAYLFSRLFGYGTGRDKDPLIVVFTSDHGEMLGEHHLFRKSLPYEGSAHVPFFVTTFNMGDQAGTSDALACLEDVFPTILDLAGIEVPRHLGALDGRSLVPIMTEKVRSDRDRVYIEYGGGRAYNSVVDDRYKYIWFADTHEEQIFDLVDDPKENTDLSADTSLLEPYRDAVEVLLKDRATKDHWVASDALKEFDRSKLKPLKNNRPSWMSAHFG